MNTNSKKIIYWAPRLLTTLFALFLSLFSLDVFDEGLSLWNTILALFMHLIPVFVVVIILLIAWRWELIGAVIFLFISFFYLIAFWGRFHWSAFVVISGITALIGILFFLNWKYKSQIQERQ